MDMFHFFEDALPEERVNRLLAQGERLYQRGKEREGMQKFAEAAALLPESPRPRLLLGRAHSKRQEYDLALKQYYQSLYFCDMADEPGILCEIALVYLRQRRYDLAEEKLRNALRIDANFRAALNGLIHIYLETGRVSEAIETQTRAWQQTPDDCGALLRIAASCRQLGENAKARQILEEALPAFQARFDAADAALFQQALRESRLPDGAEFGLKEWLLTASGSICLGSADDDGLALAAMRSGRIERRHVICAAARFLAIFAAFSWEIEAVAAAEKQSVMFAALIARLLGLPLKSPASLTKQSAVLICQWHAGNARRFKAINKIRRRARAAVTLAMFADVDEQADLPPNLPDIIGIPLAPQAKLRWENADKSVGNAYREREFWGSDAAPVEEILAQCCQAAYAAQDERGMAAQRDYYRREPLLLREHLRPAAPPRELAAAEHDAAQRALPPACEAVAPIQRGEASVCDALAAASPDHQAARFFALARLPDMPPQDERLNDSLSRLLFESNEHWLRRKILELWLTAGRLDRLIAVWETADADLSLKCLTLDILCGSTDRRVSLVLVRALLSPEEAIRRAAVAHLKRLDYSAALAPLFDALLRDLPAIAAPAVRFLAEMRFNLLLPHLSGLLTHDSVEVVLAALSAIQAHQDRSCVEQVARLRLSVDARIAEQAIRTLGAIGALERGGDLFAWLEHADPALRVAATESLIRLERGRSLLFLFERLRKESPEAQLKLLALFDEFGDLDAMPFLAQFAEQHGDSLPVAQTVMRVFARRPHPRCLPFARKAAARFPREEILQAYIAIVAAIGEEKDHETLIALLDQPPTIQCQAAGALTRRGCGRYRRILLDNFRSRKRAANFAAMDALADLADEESLLLLCSALTEASPPHDRKIAELLFTRGRDSRYARFFRDCPPEARDALRHGLLRALAASATLDEAAQACDALGFALASQAHPEIQAMAEDAGHSAVARCAAMQWLAAHDGDASRRLFERALHDNDLDVANAAFLLLQSARRLPPAA